MKNTFNIDVVVFGIDHYNTLNVIRALGNINLKVGVLLLEDSNKCFTLKSKYIHKYVLCNADNALESMLEFADDSKKIPVIACTDLCAVILDNNLDLLNRFFFIPSCSNKQGLLEKKMDKNLQLQIAKLSGFDIPDSLALNLSDYSKNQIINIKFPCIVKPEESFKGSKDNFRICENQLQLSEHLSSLPKTLKRVLIQEYIPNDEVILVGGTRTIDHKNFIFGEINKYKHSSESQNLGLNAIGYLSPENSIYEETVKLLDAIDYYGCFSVEIIKSNLSVHKGKNFFIEINLRSDGLFYFYTKAGINFPAIWALSCLNKDLNITPAKKIIYGMTEFNYLKSFGFKSLLTDIFKADTFSILSIKDFRPFLYKFIYHGKK